MGLVFILSYGLLYYSCKFWLPYGDWQDVYPMCRSPLDASAPELPFALRQLEAMLTSLIWRSHLFCRDDIAYTDPASDTHILDSSGKPIGLDSGPSASRSENP